LFAKEGDKKYYKNLNRPFAYIPQTVMQEELNYGGNGV
jgi:hypothetical protein